MFAQIGYYICVPFAWLTRLFYSLTGSYGLALILFTLVVKLVILPLWKGWHRIRRRRARRPPLAAPYFSTASTAYSEQVGI